MASEHKKQKKNAFLTIILSTVGLILVAGIIAYFTLDSAAKAAVEKIASQTLGVRVQISSLDIDIPNRSVIVNNLTVANAKGFKKPYAMTVGEIQIGLTSFEPPLLTFDTISTSDTDIYLEINEKGTNLNALKDNVDARASAKTQQPQKNPIQVIIDTLQIKKADLHVSSTFLEKDLPTLTIDNIDLTAIGKKENGVLASEAMTQVLNQVSRQALRAANKQGLMTGLSDQLLGEIGSDFDLGSSLSGGAEGKVKDFLNEKAGSIFGR